VIIEAKHAIALAFEKGIAPRVTFLLRVLEMLPAIDLDDEFLILADKIDDEGTDRRLPSKARTVEPMGAYCVPNNSLGVRQISAQRPRAHAQLRRHLPGRFF